jgi:hypothetical protein
MKVSSAEFQKEFDVLSDKALLEPLTVTRNGPTNWCCRRLRNMSASNVETAGWTWRLPEAGTENQAERLKREERELRARITTFRASNELSRDEVRGRDA